MELLVLGAGPAYTDRRGSAASSYLLTSGEARLLLDLGQGAFPNLASTVDPSELEAVVVSHLHPDHFVDLVPLRHYLRYELHPPGRVRVLAPSGLTERLDGLLGESGFAAGCLDIEVLVVGRRTIGPFDVEAALVTHTDQSFALRVSREGEAGGLVYSGDCGRAEDLVPLIRPGDVLLAEVSFGPGPVPADAQHLDAPSVARVAARSGAGLLLLTHLQMGFDPEATLAAAQAVFPGNVRLVFEGDRFKV